MNINNKTYKEMIEKNACPIMLLNSDDGKIVFFNTAAYNFYGYTKEDIDQMMISDINMFTKEEVLFELSQAKRENRNYFTFSHKLKDGSVKKVNVTGYPISLEDEDLVFSLITPIDESNQNRKKNIFDVFRNIEDAVCVVKHSITGVDSIIESSIAFNKLTEIDSALLETTPFDNIVKVDDQRLLERSEFSARLHNLNQDIFIPVNVVRTRVRYDGEAYCILVFKPQYYQMHKDEDITFDLLEPFDQLREGHLIRVELFTNTKNADIVKNRIMYVSKTLQEDFENQGLSHQLIETEHAVYLYSSSKLSDIYVVLSIFLQHFTQEHSNKDNYLCRCRIGISDYGKFSNEQIVSLKEILESFDPYEYDTIHTFANKTNYSRALEIKNGIKKAIDESELELYAQAIVNIEDNMIEGYEMLLRWNHPDHGMIMPNEFIPYAELTGEIINIDLWVIKESFKYLRDNDNDVSDLIFHINLSTKTIASSRLIPHIMKEKEGIDVENVVFEITEDPSTYQMDITIDELKELGFLLAIDDFGKGYSSFERIKNIGIQYVKIDKSFISGLTENVDDILILKAIINMCNNLNIKVIAEGIEQIEQLEFLYSRKCYIIQGFIFSKPSSVKGLVNNHKSLNNHVDKTVNNLLSYEVTSKKFYNNGRIIMQDINTKYELLTPNVAMAEALGYDFDNFVELNMLDMIPNQFKKTFVKFIDNAGKESSLKAIMLQLLNYDHKYSKVICAVSKKDNEDNYRLYIEFLEEDNESDMELLGLSNSYLQAFDEAPSGMMMISENFEVKKWNISCEKIFGYGLSESKRSNVVKLLSNEKQSGSMNALFNQALNQGQTEMVIENSNAEGKTIICRWHVNTVFDELEQSHQYICIVNDITESIKRNKEFTRLYKAIEQSKSIIIMTDENSKIEYVNEAFYEVTGYSKEETIGNHTSVISSHEHSREYYNKLWDTISSGKIWEGEFHNKKKDGNYYWCNATIYPISENGKITGYVGIQTDTTNEKALMNLNQNLKTKLFEQDKVASLGLLSSGIMHEINNPLAYIQGNIKYIIELFDDFESLDKEDIDDLKDAFLDIDKGVTQIKTIAEGLKKYIFKGTVDEKEVVDLVDEIKTVLILAKNEYKYHANVRFKHVEDKKYEVKAYASKLKQVFMNLVINAAHAIESSNKGELGNITIELIELNNEVLIQFSDDGCGMGSETIEKIYEPLFTTKEEGVGSGLGLSVSRQIIEEDHSGVITCESEIDVGTTFKIKIPITED